MQPAFLIKDALSFGWVELKKNFWFLVLLGAATFLVSGIVGGTDGRDPSVLGQLLGFVVNVFATFTFTRIGIAAVRGKSFGWGDVFEVNWSSFGFFIIASILSMVAYIVGLALLIIPGIIAMIRLNMFGYFLIEDNLSPIDALKRSWDATRGQFWNLFLFSIVLGLVCLLGFIALGVGILVAAPVVMFAIAYVYGKLRDGAAPVNPVSAIPSAQGTMPATPTLQA